MDGNPFMQQQKILLYVFPLIFAVSGINFPIGVLLYWLTTNIWSMGQQFYVIRRMPAPGSKAEEALARRRAAKGKKKLGADGSAATGPAGSPGPGDASSPNGAGPKSGAPDASGAGAATPPRQRQQPRRQPKRKR
jgi:YidC/Oxa1 family membrane protein insertase